MLLQGAASGVDAAFGGLDDALLFSGIYIQDVGITSIADGALAAPNRVYLSPDAVILPDTTTGSGISIVGDEGVSITAPQALIGTQAVPLTGDTAYFGPSYFGAMPDGAIIYSELDDVTLIAGGDITLDAATTTASGAVTASGDITSPNLRGTTAVWSPYLVSEAGTSSNLNLRASSGLVVLQDSNVANGTNPRLGFYDKSGTAYSNVKSGAAGVVQILSGSSATTYAQLWAARIYPMNGSTASRYISDDGTRTSFSGGINVNASSTLTSATFSSSIVSTLNGTAFNATGSGDVSLSGGGDILLTGADTSVPITGNGELKAIPNTTTLTTNSARWVLVSGNQYGLRRDSSTRRVKTNIVEADAAVLAAAKNLRAVHYEALEKDNDGNVVPSGKHTLGLIAEEILEAGLGCAVTYDGEGLPDGYDERVLIAALIHHVNDLETRLAALEGNVA